MKPTPLTLLNTALLLIVMGSTVEGVSEIQATLGAVPLVLFALMTFATDAVRSIRRVAAARDPDEPTVSIQGKEYYGVTGFLDATIDMALVDVDPCPKVALGLKEAEERTENGDEPTKA